MDERADKRVARDSHVPKKFAREQRLGSGSREQRSGSQDRRSASHDRRSGSLDRRSSDRSKGKEKLSKMNSVSSSSELPRRRKSVERTKGSVSLDPELLSNPRSPTELLSNPRSPTELLSNPRSPLNAIYRPTSGDSSRPEMRALPTPPAAGKVMSSRFRRLKVSIEDQVTQQSTVDVLYSDRMPRPGLNRHSMALPKAPAGK